MSDEQATPEVTDHEVPAEPETPEDTPQSDFGIQPGDPDDIAFADPTHYK